MTIPATIIALLVGGGCLFAVAAWLAVCTLPRGARLDDAACPGITVLRPLYDDEPLLEQALTSACTQDYPNFQVVFGVQNPNDPARAVAERVRARLPERDIAVVVDDTADGGNRKVANLMNMMAAARHGVLVIADSDMHVAPGYLRALAAALAQPGVGLATTLYTGRPANRSLAAALAASAITFGFLPGAALARRLGRRDSLGATMALRRETLDDIGGFAALRNELADDNILGRLVAARGLRIGLAATIPETTVPETTLRAAISHELRWARTIRSLSPWGYAMSVIQYPIAWALLGFLASGGAHAALAAVLGAWAVRGAAAFGVDQELTRRHGRPAQGAGLFLLPLRDLISIGIWFAAFTGDRVEWRGRPMLARRARAVDPARRKAPADGVAAT